MTDEKRWLEDGAPDGVRELLVAARAEQPDARGAKRALLALGVGSAVLSGATHAAAVPAAAAATKSAASATSLGFLLKWGMVGAVSAVATVGVAHVAVSALSAPPAANVQPPSPVAPVTAEAPRPLRAVPLPPAPASEPDEVVVAPGAAGGRVEPVAPVDPAIVAANETTESRRMLQEVAAVDRARGALGRGDARGALGALDAYAREFPERRFEPEALYLRMEAETRGGDPAAARAAADRLVRAYPNAPQAARARALLAGR